MGWGGNVVSLIHTPAIAMSNGWSNSFLKFPFHDVDYDYENGSIFPGVQYNSHFVVV